MRKIYFIILIILLVFTFNLIAVDHAVGFHLDITLGVMNSSFTIGAGYDTFFKSFFTLQHELTFGFGDMNMNPGIELRYGLTPLFRIGKDISFFTISASGFDIGGIFRPWFHPNHIFIIGLHQRIGAEFQLKNDTLIIGFYFGFNYNLKFFPILHQGLPDFVPGGLFPDLMITPYSGGTGFYVKKLFKN